MWIFGYVLMGLTGLITVIAGIRAIIRKKIKISDTEYQGPRARTLGIELIFLGLVLWGLIALLLSLLR